MEFTVYWDFGNLHTIVIVLRHYSLYSYLVQKGKNFGFRDGWGPEVHRGARRGRG